MSRIHEQNPYTSLYDGHSAIDEYFNLKQMLCLTDEERYNLAHCQPYLQADSGEVIFQLWQYIDRVKPKVQDVANWLGIHRTTLSNILYGNKTPSAEVLDKILNFLKSVT
jgi:hypothetical protein